MYTMEKYTSSKCIQCRQEMKRGCAYLRYKLKIPLFQYVLVYKKGNNKKGTKNSSSRMFQKKVLYLMIYSTYITLFADK